MATQINQLIDIQFTQTYEPEKARRLVEEIRKVSSALNSLIREVNLIGSVETGSHVLATTVGLGTEHSVSGLTVGQVLKAISDSQAAFQSLAFAEMAQVDAATFTGPGQGDVMQFWDGFFTMRPVASIAGAPTMASYVLGAPSADLPNGRVLTDSETITFDLSMMGEASADVVPASIGAAQLERPYSRHFQLMGA